MAQAGLKMSVDKWVEVTHRLDNMAEAAGQDSPDVEKIYYLNDRLDKMIEGRRLDDQLEILFEDDELALVESTQPL